MSETSTNNPQQQFVELSQIVGGLAHEIKNPLSTINLNLKLLGEDLRRYHDDEHKRLVLRLERVQEEAVRVSRILNDFLRYAGNFELQATHVDLCAVVRSLKDFYEPQAQAANVILRTSISDKSLYCNIDVKLIKQVLLNLLINATQAMANGGELLVKVTYEASCVLVEVIDTGPGIEADNLERVFQAYWSTKSSGSGLGLPTARRIVREHGGTLRVESEVDKGTRFLMRLPRT